eukprot:767243-Hanusia_phi.AAC.3
MEGSIEGCEKGKRGGGGHPRHFGARIPPNYHPPHPDMFYVSELNLRGKGPLARHRIAEDFSYQEGFKAIVEPENDRIYALRLNGQLLLGFVRMHDAKVSFFQDTIKYAHDRLSFAFNSGLSKSVDMKISKKNESSKKDNITLSQSVMNDLSMLDIPDEIPDWLDSDEIKMTQASQPPSFYLDSQLERGTAYRRNDVINLPEKASEQDYSEGTRDDFSDILIPYENDFSESINNPLDIPYGELDEIQPSESSVADMNTKGSHQTDFESGSVIQFANESLKNEKKPKSSFKGNKRKIRMDACIQISKEQEQRMWVTDKEWQMIHLCRSSLPYKKMKLTLVKNIVSAPLTMSLGKRLQSYIMCVIESH